MRMKFSLITILVLCAYISLRGQIIDELPMSPIERWEQYGVEGRAVELSHHGAHGNERKRKAEEPDRVDDDTRNEVERLKGSRDQRDALIMIDRGCVEFKRGNYTGAGRFFRQSVNTLLQIHGRNHPDVANALTTLALFLYERHEYTKAREKLDLVLGIRRRLCNDADDLEVAATMQLIARLHYNRERYDSAAVVLDSAMGIYQRLCADTAHAGFADALYAAGILRYKKGDHAGADSLLATSLVMFRELDNGKGHPRLAYHLDVVGMLQYERGNYALAEAFFAEALDSRLQWYGDIDHPDVARAYSNLGVVYDNLGRYTGAESYLSKALAISRRLSIAKDDSTLALRLITVGNLYARYGEFGAAEEHLTEAVQIYRNLYGKTWNLDLAGSMSSLGQYYIQQGRYYQAEALFKEARQIYREVYWKIDRADLAATYAGIGKVRQALGDYRNAASDFGEAVRMYRRLREAGEERALAEGLTDLGTVFSDRGDYARAGTVLEEAMQIYSTICIGADDPGLARCMHYLAIYHHQRGDLTKAESLFEKSLEMRRRMYPERYHQDLAQSFSGLSAIRAERGDLDGAVQALDTAVIMFRYLHGNGLHFDLARAVSAMARLYLEQEKYKEAMPLLEESLDMHRRLSQGQDHPDQADILRGLAVVHTHAGRLNVADSLFGVVVAMYERMYGKVGHLNVVLGLTDIARSAEKFGMDIRARDSYRKLLQILPKMTRESSLFESEDQQIRFQARLGGVSYSMLNFFLRSGANDDLFDAVLLTKGPVLASVEWRNRVLMELEKSNDSIAETLRQFRDLRRTLSETWTYTDSSLRGSERMSRDDAFAEVERLESLLTRQIATFSEQQQRTSRHAIQNRLNQGEYVVEFMRVPCMSGGHWTDSARYYALVLRSGSHEPTLVRLCMEHELERVLRYPVDRSGLDKTSYIHDAGQGRELYNLIWNQIDSLLTGGGKIYICPDGLLNRVAFGVLKNTSGRTLLDEYDIRYLFSSRDLIAQPTMDSTMSAEEKNAVVMGGPAFNADSAMLSDAENPLGADRYALNITYQVIPEDDLLPRESSVGTPLARLDGSLMEADAVADMLGRNGYDVATYTGTYATEEAFTRIVSPTVLHIATHSFFFSDPRISAPDSMNFHEGIRMVQYAENPLLRSGILLAGANRVWMLQARVRGLGDGLVTAYDVAHMNLTGVELVVLSACETGLGEIRNGEGVFGLKRAFRAAGAATVIMSLWKVPDDQTRRLMEYFYTNWLEKNMTKADALITAQRTMAHENMTGQETTDPYDWGAFVLVGE